MLDVNLNVDINTSGISDVGIKLIESITRACSILYEPKHAVRMAESEAKIAIIKEQSKIEISDIKLRGLERLLRSEERKQRNIEKTIRLAAVNIPINAKVNDLDEDWTYHLFNHCELVSDELMQSLWANILIGEATNPGSFSKRTINQVASMDKRDAELFTSVCQFAWVIDDEPTLLVLDDYDPIYSEKGISPSTLNHLSSIGLIQFKQSAQYYLDISKNTVTANYFEHKFTFDSKNHKPIILHPGIAIFTEVGKQLFKVCGAQFNNEFIKYSIELLARKNNSFHISKISTEDDTQS
ncbi:DUF2806 domain-containing protein [Marinobacterium rhizophilum]|uniref:DUF2806 domain-containing protein n=1 Tax=Marinobacterium rhizophilum TaxID=420402 RepID=A0ABY5HSR8_9GAMM|nr:DUF2806 domain-containing protein [Marinobacterium rhizophilum]UTW14239.1 DUF2806 domain-containing protein [Marinobacterium rhizophilum]